MDLPATNGNLPSPEGSVERLCQNGAAVVGLDSELVTWDLPPPPSPEELDNANLTDTLRFTGEMIDSVRHAADISHEKSQIAVLAVIQMLQKEFDNNIQISRRLDSLYSSLEAPSPISRVPELIENSADTKKLKRLFDMMAALTEDEQQRSWASHEDEIEITDSLSEILSIILNADHSISEYVMRNDSYRGIQALALLYQMETRKPIRAKLRDVLISICEFSTQSVLILSDSVLPMELGREFKDCTVSDKLLITQISKLLSLLMSTGLPLPIGHYVYLGVEFIRAVLKIIEDAAKFDETISNELTNLILSYNLQFRGEVENNYATQAISDIKYAPFFSQRLINLLNWFQDPLDIGYHKPPEMTNSILKILIDIFSNPKATGIFFVNDIDVLITILIRWLTDLGPGDKWRPSLLELVQLTLRNSDFLVELHDLSPLTDCLTLILQEEATAPNTLCHDLVESIFREFPMLAGGAST